MNSSDRTEAWREVEHLHRLAMNALNENLFATMETLLERAAETAEQLDDMPLVIKECFWLATARRMQGKHMQAITTYTWLIGLATDTDQSRRLADEATLGYLARAFADFVECGRFLPELPVEQLLRVADDGLAWLDGAGKPHWAACLRSQRGFLRQQRGETDAARRELEAALALARRHPEVSGYTLSSYRLAFAELLRFERNTQAEAAELLEETLNDPAASYHDRCKAFLQLAYVRRGQSNLAAAEAAARDSLDLARRMDDPSLTTSAYGILGWVQRDADQLDAATATFAQSWRWARRDGSVESRRIALMDCAQLRLKQGRQRCERALLRLKQARRAWRTTKGEGSAPRFFLAGAEGALAARRLRSSRRFLDRARPLAEQLDRATGRRDYQIEVERAAKRADELVRLVEGATSP